MSSELERQVADDERDGSTGSGSSWGEVDQAAASEWSAEKLAEARGYARGMDSATLMVVHRGRTVLALGQIDRPLFVASVRKSLLSALYGIHVAAGTLSLTSTLDELGIDDNEPSLTPEEKQATVADLLMCRSGIYHPSNSTTAGMQAEVPPRGSHPPGTYWCYNNWDFNALGTIFEQRTGRSIFVEFKERIADPIGMQDFKAEDGWYYGQHLSKHLAYHMRLSARDLARFGQLYLNRGSWNGVQIVPEAWVEVSTRRHSATSSAAGYGYMWWVGMGKPVRTEIEESSFSAHGNLGQLALVIPRLDCVIVHQYRARSDDDPGIPSSKLRDLAELLIEAHPTGSG